MVGIFKCLSALGSVPFGVALAPDSDDDSQEEDDSDEGLVLVDVSASEPSGIFVVTMSEADVDDGPVSPVEALLRAVLDRLNAANAAASLGVDEPSSLEAILEGPFAGGV
jgi:hypothetical protein